MTQQFINPVELLGLASISPDAIDSTTVKRARRRLLADLDLSDGYHTYYGQQLDRSACEQACSDLDHPEKVRAWHSLANQPALGLLLATGRLDFLLNPPLNVRFLKQDHDLLALIGPYYASRFDQALLQAFESDDVALLQGLENAPALYPPSLAAVAYRSVTRIMRRQIDAVDELVKLLDEDDDEEEANVALDEIIYGCYNAVNLNTLPDAGFEGLRSEFALSVRRYAVKLFNTFFETEVPTRLLQEVAELAIDEQTADRIQEDIQQIGQIAENNRARARQEEFAGRVGKVFEQLMAYQKQVDAGVASITTVQQWAVGLKPLFQQLNAETDKESGMFREAMAQGMRSLSVSIWNQNQANGKVALTVLDSGLSLTMPADTRAKLQADKQHLTRMVSEATISRAAAPVRTATRANPSSVPPQSSSGLPAWVWWVGILIAIVVMVNTCGNSPNTGSISNPGAGETTTDVNPVDSSSVESSASTVNPPTALPEGIPEHLPLYNSEAAKYRGNQLKNGASPLNNCFGKGRFAGPAWIVFRNGNNGTDAIVCLARLSDDKVIRNEYIRAGTDFKMTHIPAGSYYLKVFYGQDWNPTHRNACGTKGAFETDEHYSVSRDPSDQIEVNVSSTRYTTGEITLYTVAGGNMAQQPVSEDEFFRQ